MTKIVVGVDASEHSKDAVAFARDLAGATGAEVVLVGAYPYAAVPARISGAEVRAYLASDAEATLAEAAEALAGLPGVTTRAVADPSPPRALHAIAAEIGAGLIVVGSSHRGPIRRNLLGTTGTRVMHGSPCAVALVPRGYAGVSDRFGRVGCAFDGSAEATLALDAAVATAEALGAQLRVISVFDATEQDTPAADVARSLREELEDKVADLPGAVRAEAVLLEGRPAHLLAEASEELDLLFAGSRGYGPARTVLLGSVTHGLLAWAACPVIVLPSGVSATAAGAFASAAETGAA